jgi:hypothetical protein
MGLAMSAGATVVLGSAGSSVCPIVNLLLVFEQELVGLAGLWAGVDSLPSV